jgi:hypothetical protein
VAPPSQPPSKPRVPSKPQPPSTQPNLFDAYKAGLEEMGLNRGDVVRFRRSAGRRWQEGTVSRREDDGSVGVRDTEGRSRALRPEVLEVRTAGPRGGVRWVPVTGD